MSEYIVLFIVHVIQTRKSLTASHVANFSHFSNILLCFYKGILHEFGFFICSTLLKCWQCILSHNVCYFFFSVTLLSSEPEVQYVALRNINLIVQKRYILRCSHWCICDMRFWWHVSQTNWKIISILIITVNKWFPLSSPHHGLFLPNMENWAMCLLPLSCPVCC